jgi:hypothetical protein
MQGNFRIASICYFCCLLYYSMYTTHYPRKPRLQYFTFVQYNMWFNIFPQYSVYFLRGTINAVYFFTTFGDIICMTHLVYMAELLQTNTRWSSQYIYDALTTFPLRNNRTIARPCLVQALKRWRNLGRHLPCLNELGFRMLGENINKTLKSKTLN